MASSTTNETTMTGPESKIERARPAVRTWLYFVAFLVMAMVLVGGATRLTDSGLSITEWKPIHGAIPPLNETEWTEEFEKYKQIPEYEQINKGMSLGEFKFIFWWEWGHRQLGRFIGIAFFFPMVFFWTTKRLTREVKPQLVGLLTLGGLQGAIGWWMVASGLTERVDVSQYRLATHLTFASFIFLAILWVARGYRQQDKVPQCISADRHRIWFLMLTYLVLAQIFLGGLVAGTHAGLTYNTWPLMDGAFIPNRLYDSSPAWLSAFEDRMTIQFNHRMMAYLILALGLVAAVRLWCDSYATPVRSMALLTALILVGQVVLGIATLLMVVPLSLALMHQAGAILLLTIATMTARDLHDNARAG